MKGGLLRLFSEQPFVDPVTKFAGSFMSWNKKNTNSVQGDETFSCFCI